MSKDADGVHPDVSDAGAPATSAVRRAGRHWGWALLAAGAVGWTVDAALTHWLPQTWGGPNIGSGMLVLACLVLALVGGLLLLLHHGKDSGGRCY